MTQESNMRKQLRAFKLEVNVNGEGEKPTNAKALFRKLEVSEKDAIK